MFNFIKNKLKKIYSNVTEKLHSIFAQKHIDEQTILEIEKLLIKADTGITITRKITKQLQQAYQAGNLQEGSDIKNLLDQELIKLLPTNNNLMNSQVFLLVGINGSGKTTFAGKLAHHFTEQNESCLLAAADTFRAAAPEQLTMWAQRSQASLLTGKQNQDPASVTFDACKKFKDEQFNRLIIDTAGRLQTKENLMKELEKIKRIVSNQLPGVQVCTLLTIDAMLGQNSLEQAKVFHEATKLDALVLTKIDGTAKGGIVFSIAEQLNVPVLFISYGESINDMSPFDPEKYVSNLLGNSTFKS